MAVDGQSWLILGGLSLVAVAVVVWLVNVGGARRERRGGSLRRHRSDQTNS